LRLAEAENPWVEEKGKGPTAGHAEALAKKRDEASGGEGIGKIEKKHRGEPKKKNPTPKKTPHSQLRSPKKRELAGESTVKNDQHPYWFGCHVRGGGRLQPQS